MTLLRDLIARLANSPQSTRTEADIQSDIKTLLLTADFDLEDDELGVLEPSLEEPMRDGTQRRIDISIGSTVIEVKKQLRDKQSAKPYIEQLQGYVRTRIEQNGSRYTGILTDGVEWWLFEEDPFSRGFELRSSFVLSSAERGVALTEWLQSILATRRNISPTHDNMEALLGSTSPAYEQDYAYLSDLYASIKDDPTVKLKRDLWARLVRSSLGTAADTERDRLFLDHTLLVIEAAAIAHSVMSLDLSEFSADPASLLRGDAFRDASIYNVVESDFFDWVLSEKAGDKGSKFVSRLVRRIDTFNWANVEHDVLKVLYESIINAETRKSAGEYYTPDWLAEGIVEKSVTEPLVQRILDPACGSGTFIFHAVRRVLAAADEAGWDNATALKHVQDHVFGLDLHPVSVLLARVTYLLAFGERLSGDRGDLTIPVHLGDSIQWHQRPGHETDTIMIQTDGEDMTARGEQGSLFELGQSLAFPLSEIDDPSTFDRLVAAMAELASTHSDSGKSRPSVKSTLKSFGISPTSDDYGVLTETFNVLCDLNATGRDSIWGYFVRNQVRPLWLSMPGRRVDVLVGNPPWVAYRYMTEEMQKRFRQFSEDRNLWHGQKLATQQDLVGLFIVRAVEKYLHDEGRFAFVTPLAVLSRQQYEGFRSGEWGPYLRGELTELWDLDQVKPPAYFPVPSGVVFGTRHNHHPIGFERQEIKFGAPGKKLVLTGRYNPAGWHESLSTLKFEYAPNRAIDLATAKTSPYYDLAVNGATIFPRTLWFVTEETSHNPLGRASGTAIVTSMRSTQEKPPWKDIPSLSETVPSRFIFDTHLGSTIVPFRLLDPWRAVLPIDNGRLMSEKQAQNDPNLGKWWRKASDLWDSHKTKQSKLSHMENLDFQGKLTRQLKATSTRVVYTKAGTRLAAARISSHSIIIDHKLYWVAVRNNDEARYLTAILNAPVTTKRVAGYQSRGLFGGRDFDRYPFMLPIPSYDSSNELHRRLVQLATEAETIANDTDLEELGFQAARSKVRSSLESQGIQSALDDVVATLLGPEL